MESIINYLNYMFTTLPRTKEVQDLKNDLLSNMEDKYNELIRSGKSENEAVGIVISEFGNIDEIISEFNIKPHNKVKKQVRRTLREEEIEEFLEAHKKTGMLIGIGVFLCLVGVALFLITTQFFDSGLSFLGFSSDFGNMMGLVPLFILIAISVAIFIYADTITNKYRYIDDSYKLSTRTHKSIKGIYDSFKPTFTKSLIFGVMMCILSPIILFITIAINEDLTRYGVAVLLFIVSIAILNFVYFGKIKEGFEKLLEIAEYSDR